MKKVLLAIVLTTAALVPAGIIASPASAVTCSSQTYVQGSTAVGVKIASLDQSTYLLTTRIRYQQCVDPTGIFRKVQSVDFQIERTQGSTSGVSFYRGNPNVIGAWNPGSKESSGAPANYTLTWNAPNGTGVNIYASQPANERCLGGNLTFVANGWTDVTKAMPSVCVI